MPRRFIHISASDSRELAARARAGAPDESCALLAGRADGSGVRVEHVIPARNSSEAPRARFGISAEDLIGSYAEAERRGLDIVGIFHSHPSSEAVPSETDVEYMRVNPVVWVIHSGRDGSMRAYELDASGGIVGVEVREA